MNEFYHKLQIHDLRPIYNQEGEARRVVTRHSKYQLEEEIFIICQRPYHPLRLRYSHTEACQIRSQQATNKQTDKIIPELFRTFVSFRQQKLRAVSVPVKSLILYFF
jgi:hypothetical protein